MLLAELEVLLEAAAAEDHAPARAHRPAGGLHTDDAVPLDQQPGQVGLVVDGHPRVDEALAQPDRERVAHGVHPATSQRAHQPAGEDTDHRQRPADRAQAEADLAEVGLRDDQVGRCLGVRRMQPVELVAEEAGVHRDRLDAPAPEPAAGRLRVVVGVLRHPREADWRPLPEEVHHLGSAVEEGVPPAGGDDVTDDALEVATGLFAVIGIDLTGGAQRVVAGDPDAAAAAGGRAAEPAALLDEDGLEAAVCRGQGGGHARPAGTDDDHVHLGRQVHWRRGPAHGRKL